MSNTGLEISAASKHYAVGGEVIRAIDDVTLRIAPGETVALHGPSGSGKTTLLLMAAGLVAPDAGEVRFRGADLMRLSSAGIADYQRREIGLIPQSPDLFPGVPAVENAAMKLLADRVTLSDARRAAVPWLDRVGLADRLDHTPDKLSTGERARVAIARALVNEPRLILADEPTANLDTRRGRDMAELLAAVGRNGGAAVLLVTHDPDVAEVADRVEILRDGKLLPAARPDAAQSALG